MLTFAVVASGTPGAAASFVVSVAAGFELDAGLEAALLPDGDAVLDPQAVHHVTSANAAMPVRKDGEFMAVPFGNVRGTSFATTAIEPALSRQWSILPGSASNPRGFQLRIPPSSSMRTFELHGSIDRNVWETIARVACGPIRWHAEYTLVSVA